MFEESEKKLFESRKLSGRFFFFSDSKTNLTDEDSSLDFFASFVSRQKKDNKHEVLWAWFQYRMKVDLNLFDELSYTPFLLTFFLTKKLQKVKKQNMLQRTGRALARILFRADAL